ncbi:MAG TPA: threonine ammonia-lyase, biosynthetic [Hellea balneolensis]|uniref:L-threonine dehydratase n=1 Tax=Hellea balneolensis TaxID=287478 RepID=A0A7C5QQ84_9PROT|nr:threonine ammonia-lyase, biosynthetic [Hellea balneolensis]
MSGLLDISRAIEQAQVYDLAKKTPLEHAGKLSRDLGATIWLKREDLQDVFSFKIRGATNRIAKLSDTEKAKGVVAASAGNHAQGMASAAAKFGTKAVIFMPVTTPPIKTEAVRAMGADIQLVGDGYDQAYEAALAYAQKTGAVFIHPFDEPDVIAGQGTIGQEILEQLENKGPLDAIYISVGGGGLLAGIGSWVRTHSPKTRIIAVEPKGAATLAASLTAGQPTSLNTVDGFADGVAVKRIGQMTFKLAQDIHPETILVSNDEICASVRHIFEQTRTVVEPAGALALAGLIKHGREHNLSDGNVVAIVSGANVNFDRIGHVVERAELGAGDEILLAATLPERPGAFLEFCECLGTHAVSEFNYRFSDQDIARVLVGVKIKSAAEGEDLKKSLQDRGMEVTDMSHNRLAKIHLRHMVGGQSPSHLPEQIYSFEFPERPGALRDFLVTLDGRWNISLFHYRNHGASTGEVLCGFQLPANDREALETSLRATGFSMSNETENPAYQYFLKRGV